MAKESKNIIVGAAEVFISDTQAALPDATDLTTNKTYAAALHADTDWTDVGYTQEGVEVSYEPDYGDVAVDQLLDSARIFKQGMKVTVNTTFAEATLENLLVAWGQNANTLATGVLEIEAGQLGDAPHERGLAFVGPAPLPGATGKERVYHVDRAVQTESSSHALKRDAATALPVSFRILPGDPVGGKSIYGTVRDRAKTA